MIETGFFDLDKTTIDEKGQAYAGLAEAFQAKQAFTHTILTARGFPRFREAISDNSFLTPTTGTSAALENGARIIDSETYDNLFYQPLNPDEQTAICDYIEGLENLRYVAFHPEESRTKTILWSPDRDEARRLHDAFSHNADVFTSDKNALYQTIKKYNPCMITCRTYEDIHKELPEITFYSRGTTVNFLPKDTNKGTAAQIIADMQRLDLSKTMAAGNDHNDESILALSGLGYPVAVGNDLSKDIKDRLPEHTIFIPDPTKLGNFILKEVQQ